jgi:nitroreductase
MANKQIQEALEWRYAVKKFDPTKKISEKDLATLLESLKLAT